MVALLVVTLLMVALLEVALLVMALLEVEVDRGLVQLEVSVVANSVLVYCYVQWILHK